MLDFSDENKSVYSDVIENEISGMSECSENKKEVSGQSKSNINNKKKFLYGCPTVRFL